MSKEVKENYKLEPLSKLLEGSTVQGEQGYLSTIFDVADLEKITVYDKYLKLLEGLINHNQLKGDEQWLNGPAPTDPQAAQENEGDGYLTFSDILERLKVKKYGPGKNSVKQLFLL